MNAPAYLLTIHLRGGQSIRLACESWEIIPDRTDESGAFVPGGLNYTPHDWEQTLGMIAVSDISAVEQHVRPDIAEAMRSEYEQRVREEREAADVPSDVTLLGSTWSRAD